MLVLTRKIDESIIIGDNIKITLCAIKGSQARIGIEAPQGVKIYREELIRDNNKHDKPEA